ncbi:MAG: hypothetical protein NTW32_09890 [Chloroflexi bacterium]|nr:hypothetical protein [Chloroflexota bacterium]
MTIPQLLHSMCAELPDGDLNAIRKARGFSASETASRTSFASFYVTAVGLEKIMQAITPEEAVGLGLLHETGEVDVSFFERIYGTGNQRGTYTQRYKYTFDNVKKNLVRRGLVVMAEVKMRGDNAQMERWRFALPPEFAPYLPPIASKSNVQPGQFNDKTIRKKLLELIGGEPAIPKEVLPLAIKRGSLYIKEDLFSIASFEIWQKTAWQSTTNTYKPNVPASLSPIDAALKLLNTESWIDPKSIESALNIYCFGVIIPSAEKLLHKGWELGFLSRLEINGAANYRIAPQQNLTSDRQPYPSNLEWADTTSAAGCVKIDLRVVPLTDLEKLNILTELTIENGVLIARPSLVKLGRAIPEQRNSLLSIWLAEQVPAFGKVLETVNANWGKTILHENLLFARVRDLSLRIQLERELKEKIIVLSEHFIAFPLEARASVEKVLKKTGFVTKTIKP